MIKTVLFLFALTTALHLASEAAPICSQSVADDPRLKIDPDAMAVLEQAKLDRHDVFKILQVVAQYEANGCWGKSTGNFDGQWLSAGVMQWNFGSGTLQEVLKRFREKSPDSISLNKELSDLMPLYGQNLFDPACRPRSIERRCREFLTSQYIGEDHHLSDRFQDELSRLFEHPTMRQIQLDLFIKKLTAVLDDLNRIFQQREPQAWQVAWAMDIRTQQGNRFPTDRAIRRIRNTMRVSTAQERQGHLLAIVRVYGDSSETGDSAGTRLDYQYNVGLWTRIITNSPLPSSKEEVIRFTNILSRTANGDEGLYQADTFQRRATIVFGKGMVHGSVILIPQ